ncbi:MAG: ATP-binding cassette domain-containing protein [Lentisphaerae bacterium]|nr:ATP-binding cassette domain-containing protein [Lentisphaerota bacterium]
MTNFKNTNNAGDGVVHINEMTIWRGNRKILDKFSMTVRPGDFLALIGSNGSGKTTILRAMTGFVPFQTGELQLFGEKPRNFSTLRKRIGYVPQTIAIDYRLPFTVRDIVGIGRCGRAGLGRRLTKRDNELIDIALADTGLTKLASRPIGHLSGGELQKTQIARVLCQESELLLLDEPTVGLDLGAQHDFLNLISTLHQKYTLTTILVMHDLASLPDQCKRAVVIDKSRKVFDGSLTGVFSPDILNLVYKKSSSIVTDGLITLYGNKESE